MGEFIGLRPKMYSILFGKVKKNEKGIEEKEKLVGKGITKTARNNQLRHTSFRECLFQNRTTTHHMKVIRSESHKVYINDVKKKGLCNFDDKRYWMDINSFAFGHYKIKL